LRRYTGADTSKSSSKQEPRWLDTSFCHKLPARGDAARFYADATHPVDLAGVEKRAQSRGFASVGEFCGECEWVFENADAFAFVAAEEGKVAGEAATAAAAAAGTKVARAAAAGVAAAVAAAAGVAVAVAAAAAAVGSGAFLSPSPSSFALQGGH
jgi:hypothetical protein